MSYYHQITSNMMSNSQNTSTGLTPTYTQTSTGNMMSSLLGTQVKINRGGPDSVTGTMVSSQNQFIVLRSTDGIVYVNRSHIKSVTQMGSGGNKSGRSLGTANFIHASTFNQLLQSLRHKFVQINRGGPEKIEGFIAEVTQDFVLVVVNKELIRIPIFHIKTLSVSTTNRSSGSSNNKNQDNNNQNNNKSGNSNNKNNNKSGNQNKNNNTSSSNKNKNSSSKQKSNNNKR